jgi:cellulose synthase/poly-beta-1,6-N-acetylglucosamine synthase-like glycosyltransferase
VVNDGSKDNTAEIVNGFISQYPQFEVTLINQTNQGKANALNNALRNYAVGKLVMCLDADSTLAPNALLNSVKYFRDPKVMALSANIKIINDGTFLNLIQKFEYLINYQVKRALTTFNIEYIVGGIGSVFRRDFIKKIGYYDGDTVTEDIDLTMKILRHGNNNVRVIYGSDVIAYSESVGSIKGLIRQRSRWKWGRCQTFWKNRSMFFNSDKKYTKGLSYIYLPYAIFGDLTFLFEPVFIAFIIYIMVRYFDLSTIFTALVVITFFNIATIAIDNTLSFIERLKMFILAPAMYLLFNVISYVEFNALIKAAVKLPKISQSILQNKCGWEHVERKGTAIQNAP